MQKKKKDLEPTDEPGITKLEFRRRMLKQRVREWDAFLRTKPNLVSLSASYHQSIHSHKLIILG